MLSVGGSATSWSLFGLDGGPFAIPLPNALVLEVLWVLDPALRRLVGKKLGKY